MSTQILPVAVGVPVVVRQPLNQIFLTQPAATGTMQIEYGNDGVNYTVAPDGLIATPYSLMPNTYQVAQLGFVRVTAAVAAGNVIVGDMTQFTNAGYPRETLVNSGVAYTTANATTEGRCISVKFPVVAGVPYLQRNWMLEIDASFTATNNANVKTLRAYFGNTAGTALPTIFATQVLTSSAGARMVFRIASRNDGATAIGSSLGAAGGWGISTTAPIAISTLATYLTNETEICLTIQKATGTDAVVLDSFAVKLYQ